MYHILISRNVFFNENDGIRKQIHELLDLTENKDIQLVLVSRSLPKYKKIINEDLTEPERIKYVQRGDISRKFTSNNKNIMLLGAVDEDIRIAANNRILLINPLWLEDVEEKIQKYGYKINNTTQILQCIEILSLSNALFHDFQVDEKTRLIAISNANKYYAVKNEAEMIKNYKETLKHGNEKYKYAVYFHYLTMIIKMEEFKDVDLWMSVPSSTGSTKNNIYEIVRHTRYLLNNRKSEELFIRHEPAKKSTYMSKEDRIRIGSKRHFDTIHLNSKYKGKLKGKKVCVLDDYVTNGTSFECMRNLLLKEEVSEIILVAIGSFKSPYQKEVYELDGDIFTPNYNYSLLERKVINGAANENSSEVINKIYDIIK